MVKLFVEGGGDDNHALKTECRRAFSQLLERAGFERRMPRIVACGGRRNAFEQFSTSLGNGGPSQGEGIAILLVDSEAPVTHDSPWEHVAHRAGDNWVKPTIATDDHLHLMIQCMETWLLADLPALSDFYGQGFQQSALPGQGTSLEDLDKGALHSKLKQATRQTRTKGTYGKGTHSFKLLAMIDPSLLCAACPAAKRFFAALDRLLP